MGELKKLKIVAYEDNAFSTPTGNEFSMMVNPGTYEQKKGVRYNKDDAMEGGNNPTYQGYEDENVSFEFLLDATGVIPGAENKDLPAIIADLEKTAYTYVGTAHESPYIKVIWGTLDYQGRIKEMKVTYTFFSPDGKPLRAKVKLELIQYVDITTQEKEKNKSSPDLTHLVTVKAGDTLPNLCQKIYKSMMYCSEVARVNGLSGYRYLEPGTELFFPPLTNG